MIIDFHVHGFPDDVAAKAIPILAERGSLPPRTDGTVQGILESMEHAQINHSVVLSIATRPTQTEKINDWAAEIQNEKITAFGSIHPDYTNWKHELERIDRKSVV